MTVFCRRFDHKFFRQLRHFLLGFDDFLESEL